MGSVSAWGLPSQKPHLSTGSRAMIFRIRSREVKGYPLCREEIHLKIHQSAFMVHLALFMDHLALSWII
jgi:hypothetical protein